MQLCLTLARVVEIGANSHVRLAPWLLIALTLEDRVLHAVSLV